MTRELSPGVIDLDNDTPFAEAMTTGREDDDENDHECDSSKPMLKVFSYDTDKDDDDHMITQTKSAFVG